MSFVLIQLYLYDREQSLRRKEGPPTTQETKRPLFALVKLAPPFHKHYLYPVKSIQQEPLMSRLFIKSTLSLEIIYSIININSRTQSRS